MVETNNKEKVDLVLLFIYPIFASTVSVVFKVNFFWSIIVFLILPSLYLSIKNRNYAKKALIFSISAIPASLMLDFLAQKTSQWLILQTIFPFKILGIVTVEAIMWGFSLTYLCVVFYEYFLDRHISKKLFPKRFKNIVILLILISILAILMSFVYPSLLDIGYFYLLIGIIGILIPIIFVLLKFPNLVSKFFKLAIYFFIHTFIYEVTGLALGWWTFPAEGKFIGWVSLFQYRFPLEEFIFWFMLCAMAALSWYEYFDDDCK